MRPPHGALREAEERATAPGTDLLVMRAAHLVREAELTLHDAEGLPVLAATAGDPLVARVRLDFVAPSAAAVILSVYGFEEGTLLAQCVGQVDPAPLAGAQSEVQVDFVMPALLLAPGVYTVGVTVTPEGAAQPVAWRFGRTTLYVQGGNGAGGLFTQPFECRVVSSPKAAAVLPVS